MIPNEVKNKTAVATKLTQLMIHVIGVPIEVWTNETNAYPIREALTKHCLENNIESLHQLFGTMNEETLDNLTVIRRRDNGRLSTQETRKLYNNEKDYEKALRDILHSMSLVKK